MGKSLAYVYERDFKCRQSPSWCKLYLSEKIDVHVLTTFLMYLFVQLFFIIGLPLVLTTDQGNEFNNKVNAELMRMFGVKHQLTTAYHPQANGLDERFDQTLANSLAKFAQVNWDSWDEYLGAVVYAYNSAVQVCILHVVPFVVTHNVNTF